MVVFFVIAVAVPAIFGLYVAWKGAHRSRRCPYCAAGTLRIRSRTLHLLGALLRSSELHSRWCIGCGWQGTVRLPRLAFPVRPRPTTPTGRPADRVDIRQLNIDGQPWKVMVQCWAEGGRWVGRLLFMGPDGQAHLDGHTSLQGGSALEVLSCALSIPDQALAGRIRRVSH